MTYWELFGAIVGGTVMGTLVGVSIAWIVMRWMEKRERERMRR